MFVAPPNAYALSRMPQAQRYEDLVAQLSKKSKAAALQLLLFYECEDSAVAPLTKIVQEPNRAHALAAHHLLRLAAPRVARGPQHAAAMEALENLMQSKERGTALAALWTVASMARHAEEPRRGILAGRVAETLARLAEREAREGPEALAQCAALSACLALGPACLALSQVRGTLWPAVLRCFSCPDAVGVRHALLLLLDRAAAEPGGVSSIVEGLLHSPALLNLRDPLARVYFVQLCMLDPTPAALAHVERALEDPSFRVAHEALAALCRTRPWAALPLARAVPPIVAAFQSPRPVLHYSALRACALLGRSRARAGPAGGGGEALAPLLPLVLVQAQNDSVFHRWRALAALAWLASDPAAVAEPLAAELRTGELAAELLAETLGELAERAALSGAAWGEALLACLGSWLALAPRSLDATLLLSCWRNALACGTAPAAVRASVAAFVEHPFPPARAAFAAQLHANAAQLFGEAFGALAAGDAAASSSMIQFLEGLVLAAGSLPAVRALVCAASAANVDESQRQRIRGFLSLLRPEKGFDPELCREAQAAGGP